MVLFYFLVKNTFMKQIFQVLLIGFVFSLSGCFDGGEKDAELKTFENIVEYTIDIPKEWEVFPKEEYPQSLVFSAKEPAYSSRIPSIIAIAKESSRPQNLDQFISRNLEEVRRSSQDFTIISETDIDRENVQSRLIEYTERRSSDHSVIGIYSYYLLPNEQNNSYIVTMVFDGSHSQEKKDSLSQIVTSFHFKTKEIN